jgi:hypothetical protein
VTAADGAPLRLLAAPVAGASADWSAAVPLLVWPIHLSAPVAFASVPIPEVSDLVPSDVVSRSLCLACHEPVLVIRDIDTDELLQLDVERVDEGHVALFAFADRAVCRQYGRPALAQPAYEVHACAMSAGAALADGDPYEDDSPAMQQARWRTP